MESASIGTYTDDLIDRANMAYPTISIRQDELASHADGEADIGSRETEISRASSGAAEEALST